MDARVSGELLGNGVARLAAIPDLVRDRDARTLEGRKQARGGLSMAVLPPMITAVEPKRRVTSGTAL